MCQVNNDLAGIARRANEVFINEPGFISARAEANNRIIYSFSNNNDAEAFMAKRSLESVGVGFTYIIEHAEVIEIR